MTDVEIGRRVVALRGDRSQQWIVNALRERGFEYWHQATVSRVELGSRPLRILEAFALADAFGITVHELVGLSMSTNIAERSAELTSARNALATIRKTLDDYEARRA